MWLIVVLALILFIVWTEDRSQNCLGKPCQHSAPPVLEKEDPAQSIEKIIYSVNLRSSVVEWRRAVLAGLVVTLLLYLVMKPNIPSGSEFIVTALFLILAYYLASGWFIWAQVVPTDSAIEKALVDLRKMVKA
jgi:hypothetical protein